MRRGEELHALEAAGRDDHAYIGRPNVCIGERVAGRLAQRGGSPVVLCEDGRVVGLGERGPAGRWGGRPVTATVVEQIGQRPRAYDACSVGADPLE